MCGVELANGFGELTDAVEQRVRLEAEMAKKQQLYGERYPIDDDFLAALARMPAASGCALGFDRLVMLAAGALRVEQVMWDAALRTRCPLDARRAGGHRTRPMRSDRRRRPAQNGTRSRDGGSLSRPGCHGRRALGIRTIDLIEVKESRAGDAGRRVTEEAIALAGLVPERAAVVVLDSRGEIWRVTDLPVSFVVGATVGAESVCFLIGGPDGIGAALHRARGSDLAFGAATWPHQLVRIMLTEQIYRAITILSGHPYHRD